ncbi:chemotaxis protein CheA [Cellvibrio sp. KY-YJ-3]|uniref:chemotaxis protein CheA n=1 Tax=Cellvibrio sp. KY-YJ-3 TaxID=454662 RepID=UPI001248F063|nr:chemotaxis protein CheA [Cellvibrio sp. KY-YJ-3]QEY13021.1 chemotaxis protein CheA [Cellvibrio sp. KY-YJ-3]
MSFGDDEDILQDFLVEAGEILERLSQQLVDLEQRPEDKDLLNAIFRGFHTVKGGAGFLALTPMVECCHLTENLFDILRNGKRAVTSELMDVVLEALDMVNQQFELVSQREELPPVDPALIASLERLVSCEDLNESAVAVPVETAVANPETTAVASGDITDAEFEQLLDAIAGVPAATVASAPLAEPVATVSGGGDDISEDEFEALLDQLHGRGKGPGVQAAAPTPAPAPVASTAVGGGDEISEDEFEALLDQLHGKGKGPGVVVDAPAPAAAVAPEPAKSSGDLISDDEFDALLDQLHGKGKGPGTGASTAATPAPVATKPAPAPEVKPEAAKPVSPAPAVKKVEPPKPAAATAPATPAADKEAPQVETTVRVDTQRLDDIMNMVGELVLVRNRLVRLGNGSTNEALVKAVANLDVVTADLQTSVMKTRMQPIKKVFGRFPRVVRDLARSLRKEINLELVGEETDLDKNLVEALADPLVHLVRNSVDHGIEFPDVREANGKSRIGQVVLSAEQEGDHILLSISDDGAGMDPVKLRRIAVEKGMFDEDTANRLSDTEAYNLIFAPGFSTKKEISDVSGRGVGMDVVKTKITQLNGTVEIKSELGKGTRFIIKVPLTLAIMPTLMFMLGQQTFAFPLVSVNEIFHMDLTKSHIVDGQDCVAIRDQAIPLFYMKDWLVKNAFGHRPDNAHVVIVTVGSRRVGFVVDQLIGQEEVVIKPLGKMLQGTPGMAGATITGDGTIALILDIPSLLRRYAKGSTSWGHS